MLAELLVGERADAPVEPLAQATDAVCVRLDRLGLHALQAQVLEQARVASVELASVRLGRCGSGFGGAGRAGRARGSGGLGIAHGSILTSCGTVTASPIDERVREEQSSQARAVGVAPRSGFVQPLAQAESQRRAAWPARPFLISSASRASRHTVASRVARPLGPEMRHRTPILFVAITLTLLGLLPEEASVWQKVVYMTVGVSVLAVAIWMFRFLRAAKEPDS